MGLHPVLTLQFLADMKATLLALLPAVFLSISAQADGLPSAYLDQPILVQALDQNGRVKDEFFDFISSERSSEGNFHTLSPSMQSQSWLGACFSPSSEICHRSFNFGQELPALYSRSMGRLTPPIAGMFDSIASIPFPHTTRIQDITPGSLIAKVKNSFSSGPGDTYRISLAPAFLGKQVHFALPSEDAADRRPLQQVNAPLANLSEAVFQIQMFGKKNSSLGGGSSDIGTGFFISGTGHILTNHHVISSQPDCFQNLVCDLNIMQTGRDGRRSTRTLPVEILAKDTTFDFVLLKANLPPGTKVKYLPLANDEIGPDLVTLGYPGDQTDLEQEGTVNRLTYSFGKLMGFHSKAMVTSAYIYSGASGSPILNAESLSLVGINSNGAGAMGPNGAPAIIQPIHEIERQFGIYKYLTGEKQRRVNALINELSRADSFAEANRLLDLYLGEKTQIGRGRLKMILTNNDSRDVRRAILQKLDL